jgi:hypothetical protein
MRDRTVEGHVANRRNTVLPLENKSDCFSKFQPDMKTSVATLTWV